MGNPRADYLALAYWHALAFSVLLHQACRSD